VPRLQPPLFATQAEMRIENFPGDPSHADFREDRSTILVGDWARNRREGRSPYKRQGVSAQDCVAEMLVLTLVGRVKMKRHPKAFANQSRLVGVKSLRSTQIEFLKADDIWFHGSDHIGDAIGRMYAVGADAAVNVVG
jgi:hypothetical protein